MIFDSMLQSVLPATAEFYARTDGPAFLKVARDLYRFDRIDYLALNVPVRRVPVRYMHCWHASDGITQCFGDSYGGRGCIEDLDWNALRSPEGVAFDSWPTPSDNFEGRNGVVFALQKVHGETALAAISWRGSGDSGKVRYIATRDMRHLMNYFHCHILRINGLAIPERLMIMTARELDCLSWAAAGKSAYEASLILGISEHTVRFHLSIAREKLDCTTTTQAVAKAVHQRLIAP